MFTKPVLPVAVAFLWLLCSLPAVGQQNVSSSASASAQEFPVTFQQTIVAGKTPAGTKVQAKLGMATLVNGTVIPQGATFSGEVVESVAKTNNDSSKLSIRIDSARWKNGSATLHVYLVGWFYPPQLGQDQQYGPQGSARTSNGQAEFPSDTSRISRPFPSGDSTPNGDDISNSATSEHRVQMKNVQTNRGPDGTITLLSTRSNIKLDRSMTYVLSNSEVLAAPVTPAASK